MTSLAIQRPHSRMLASAHLLMVALATMLVPMSLFVTRPLAQAALLAASPPAPTRDRDLAHLPLSFIPNVGQFDAQVRYQTSGMGGTVSFTPQELVLALPVSGGAKDVSPQAALVHMQFLGANQAPSIAGSTTLPGVVNFLQGNDQTKWHANVPTYAGLSYQHMYAGIDLSYEGTQGQLKSTYTVAPNANPAQIRWRYAEATSVQLDRQTGSVHVGVPGSATPIVEFAPVAWQDIGGQRIPVEAHYVLGADSSIGFGLGSYNAAYPLTIDPVTAYRTFLGGTNTDEGYDIVVDNTGVYIVGYTFSSGLTGFTGTQTGNSDVFVAKFDLTLSTLIYGTYLGGSGADQGYGIAVDPSGNAYVTGQTVAGSPTAFPTTAGVVQTANGGGSDAFVTKLGTNGAITYSTLFGSNLNDTGNDIAVDASGKAYIVGTTLSNTGIGFSTNKGGSDAFMVGFNAGATATLFTPQLRGGTSNDEGNGIAITATNIYIVGTTNSGTFIAAGASLQAALSAGGSDAFMEKYAIGGGAPSYGTYLGGNNNDVGKSIAVDTPGNVYIAGQTSSNDFLASPRTPVGASYQSTLNGTSDGFVTQLNVAGSAALYNTYLGGSSADSVNSILVDGSNNVYVTGDTFSTDFPVPSVGALQPANAGGQDAFVTQFNTGSGNSLVYSTYLGGNTTDSGRGIAIRTDSTTTPPTKEVYVVGATSSSAFPNTVANTPYQTANGGGGNDAFVVRVGIKQPLLVNDTATTNEDTGVVIPVLTNDVATPATFNNATLQVVAGSLTPSTAGTTTVNAAGTITFAPAANQNSTTLGGNVTFKYTVCDSDGVCGAPATVTVTVTPVNDAPSFTNGGDVTVSEDSGPYTAAQTSGMVPGPATATDETGQTLTFSVINNNNALFSVQPTIDAAGNLSFTPAPNANGSAVVSVTLKDNGGTANGGLDSSAVQAFTIIVTPVNDPPVLATNTALTVAEGATIAIPTANLRVTDVDNPPANTLVYTVLSLPATGALQLSGTPLAVNSTFTQADIDAGVLRFVQNGNDPPPATDSFTFNFTDGVIASPIGPNTFTFNITPVNDPPVANADPAVAGDPNYTTAEDTALNVSAANGVLTNDTDVDGPTPLTAVLVQTTQHGTLTLNADGSFSYTPAASFNGTDTFTYQARDGTGGLSNNATVTITTTSVPDAPVAQPDTYTTAEDIALSVAAPGVLANDSDPDCTTGVQPDPYCQPVLFGSVVTQPAHGSVTVNSDGSFVYTPAANYNGTDSFVYQDIDSNGLMSNNATVTITITPVNDPPTVTFPTIPNIVDEEGTINLPQLTIGDDATPSSIETVTISATLGTVKLGTIPSGLSVRGNGTSRVTLSGTLADLNTAVAQVAYTGITDANGTDQVTITVNDNGNTGGGAQTGSYNLPVTINAVNDAPVANNDTFTVYEEVLTATNVLANDNDNKDVLPPAHVPGGGLDPSTVKIVTAPTNGTATVNANGTVSYKSNVDYSGPDSFTYQVCDKGVPLPSLCSNTATVNLTVIAVNDSPTATKGTDPVTVAEDSGAYTQPWGTNFTPGPANESAQTLSLTTTSSNAALFAQQPSVTQSGGTGTLSFTPAPNANGNATITLAIKDNGGTLNGGQDTLTVTFTIIVTPVNDPPIAVNDSLGVGFNAATTLNVLANDSIAPDANEILSIAAITTAPQHGTAVIANGGANILFTPTTGYKGADSFVYQMCDNGQTNGQADPKCATATVTLSIGIFNAYLPILVRVPESDLITSFTLSPEPTKPGEKTLVTVTVTNTGTLAANNFWVDFYIEPKVAPTGANTPWNENCKLTTCFGIAWFVSTPIKPGESITLTSTSDSYVRANTVWRGYFIRQTKDLYVVVDSWNRSADGKYGDPNGAVREFDETNNVFHKEISLSTSNDTTTDEPQSADEPTPIGEPQVDKLAPRSLTPQ